MRYLLIGFLLGLLAGFNLWGLRILPETTWQYSFGLPPIEMEATMYAPKLIRLPGGTYYCVYQYESHGDYWYLQDYQVYRDGYWTGRQTYLPLTLGISKSYEILMLPDYYYFLPSDNISRQLPTRTWLEGID